MSKLDDLDNINFKLKGRAKHIFQMLELLANTEPDETCPLWWELRAFLIAEDRTRENSVPLDQRRN